MSIVEDLHDYLRLSWYAYNCQDKNKITEIIHEELFKKEYKSEQDLKIRVKRRCQAELFETKEVLKSIERDRNQIYWFVRNMKDFSKKKDMIFTI